MGNKVYINQPAGLGDIFFCQKIAETFIYNGYEVYWPVKSSINWIGDYLINSKHVHYIDENQFIQPEDCYVLTLDGAQNTVGYPIMTAKYRLIDIDWTDWLEFFNFKRNEQK